MKTYPKCIECFFRQTADASKLAGFDDALRKKAMDIIEKAVPNFSMELSPPEMARTIYGTIYDLSGGKDVYCDLKKKSNEMALELYQDLNDKVERSDDPLFTAVRTAVAGNVIDYGVPHSFAIDQEFKEALGKDFAIFDIEAFREALAASKKVLYLLDNAGEIVFDKILVETLNVDVVCAVRGTHVINDVTMADAVEVGLDTVSKVISSGSDLPGTRPEMCTDEFREYYNNADLIISKGQGNFETLSDEDSPIFFIFKAKCDVVAEHIGCELGDIILKKSDNYRSV